MHAILRSNPLRLLVLIWFSGWLLLVMPGHKRGIVTLPGAETAQAAAASCCEPAPSCCESTTTCCDRPTESTEPTRPIDPAKHCAICFLKSHLTDPPAVTLYTPYLGELDELTYLIESSILDALATPQLLRGRAPPA